MTDLPARGERRASDDDREVTATDLRDAFAQGRLDPEEYQARLDAVWQARTYGELDRITADLPEPDVRRREAERSAAKRRRLSKYVEDWRGWGGLAVLLVGIWLVTSIASGGLNYFWPIWPLGIMAIGIVASMVSGDDDDEADEQKPQKRRHPQQPDEPSS